MVEVVQALLEDWGEARVDELSEVVGRDPGNVRKYLSILRARGVATKTSSCTWTPTLRSPGPEDGPLVAFG
jgi:predicted transcriptional regulator